MEKTDDDAIAPSSERRIDANDDVRKRRRLEEREGSPDIEEDTAAAAPSKRQIDANDDVRKRRRLEEREGSPDIEEDAAAAAPSKRRIDANDDVRIRRRLEEREGSPDIEEDAAAAAPSKRQIDANDDVRKRRLSEEREGSPDIEEDAAAAAPSKRQIDANDDVRKRRLSEEREGSPDIEQDAILDGNMSVVASHYNELKEGGRNERSKSRIFYMRNFNNWIKSQLINEYLNSIRSVHRIGDPMRVLDMCCGKGGDLLKWEKAKITHLICTDIADVSVEQCKRRYEDMMARSEQMKFAAKFSAEFFACDSTLVRLRERYKDPSLKLDLVSVQFAFHYSFESLSQADCMVRNAAECLQKDGYFIATIPDANEIMRRLRESPHENSFGNDVYNIEFVSETNPPPLFGAKYQFHLDDVVDCPEFLVHFATLVKLCRKHGLKLHRRTTFADYYKESFDRGRQLLQRMNGFETIHPNRCSNDEQYAHVTNHVKGAANCNSALRPVGTLSKSEWEAATLYLVCAFRKCKNTWDAEGKPVFEFDD